MAAPALTPSRAEAPDGPPHRSVATLVRLVVTTCLAVGAVLTVVSIWTMPDFSGDHVDRLLAVADAGGSGTVSALAWVSAQLLVGTGLLGVAHLLRSRAPVLAVVAGLLLGLQAFGHAVYGGVNLVMLSMARDTEAVEVHAAVLADVEGGVGIPFMALGLLGTVLGMLVLAVALWRGRLGPRWLGPTVAVWVVLEFAGGAVSSWSGYASALLYLAVLGTLSLVVHRSSVGHWQTAVEAAERAEVEAPA
ncbi:hypothetical protein ACQE98_09100 [Ornithinimicrobium sp. W1679]|uniref:hypothetical protein n=1 Tax=Ornithinimicrobium sp. W1679 TaxID=3418770 RepID=UPI003CEF9DDF